MTKERFISACCASSSAWRVCNSFKVDITSTPSSYLLLVAMPGFLIASLLLVVRPGAPSSFLVTNAYYFQKCTSSVSTRMPCCLPIFLKLGNCFLHDLFIDCRYSYFIWCILYVQSKNNKIKTKKEGKGTFNCFLLFSSDTPFHLAPARSRSGSRELIFLCVSV